MLNKQSAVALLECELRGEIDRHCRKRGIELDGCERDDAVRRLSSSLLGVLAANIERLAEDAVEEVKVKE